MNGSLQVPGMRWISKILNDPKYFLPLSTVDLKVIALRYSLAVEVVQN